MVKIVLHQRKFYGEVDVFARTYFVDIEAAWRRYSGLRIWLLSMVSAQR